MASTTYNNLVADLQQWMEDADDDFEAALPKVISQGEARVLRDLDFDIFFRIHSDTILGNEITVPSDFISNELLVINGYPLVERSFDYVTDHAGTSATRSQYVARKDAETLMVAPSLTITVNYSLRYRCTPTGLSEGNQTTWIAENLGDVLFYACLMESEAQLKADERIPVWTAAYTDAIEKFKTQHPELARKSYP